jgi:two-component system, NarL family, response regulator YdfI
MPKKKDGGGTTRVLVVATSAVRRGGLEALVKENPSLRLSGSVPGTAGLAARARELQPDAILADIAMEDRQFIAAIASLAEEDIPVVVLIDGPEPGWAASALRAGVRAIIPRESSGEEILHAIRTAVSGLVLLEAGTATDLAKYAPSGNGEGALEQLEELSPREVEVLRWMAEGFGNKEIATRLGISDHTVKFHISSILAKLGVASRTEAVTQGIRMGLVLL